MAGGRSSETGAFVLGGGAGAVLLSWYAARLDYPLFALEHPVQMLPVAVFFVLGGLPAFLFVRKRALTPPLIAVLIVALWVRAETERGPGDPLVGLVFVTAPIGIALMLVSSQIERHLSRRLT
ncbi:hypothetical protein [Natrialba asiatica]|uniref:TRAP dicarboxylate transporter subunit DctM n=1 Tax=Natrialba asiatica (strain ATCC 700177 / DSM 12278 / JCM 9576 / FERM P-10747 / NBRC 102637 / 172P1) TaxID=29540 RepID=M0AV59_NATA1|nr:hypothetical protein [Natrialba asiatica]ELZ02566.1 TRAP dicarboxylate transporter subunit DctM [Natrialba asiatica DSM 12278]